MKRSAVVMMLAMLVGCGSGGEQDANGPHPSYTVEKNLGLYVGYQKAKLVTDDGRLHDPVYNLVTSVIMEGCYLAYNPDPKYNTTYNVILRRKYRDNVPVDKTGTVYIGYGSSIDTYDQYPAYIPGSLYY